MSVPREPTPDEVGRALLDGLERERRNARSIIEDTTDDRSAQLRAAKGWAAFCQREAGVPETEYRPEIRLQLYEHGDGTLHLRPFESPIDAVKDLSVPRELTASGLGETALRVLETTPPAWPIIQAAVVHAASRNRIVIFPTKIKVGGPARVVQADDPSGLVGEAVRLALRDSEAIQEDDPREQYEEAMLAVGVDERQIALRRAASVSLRSDGSVMVTALRPVPRRGWEPIPGGELSLRDDAPDVLGAAVMRALAWDYLEEPEISG